MRLCTVLHAEIKLYALTVVIYAAAVASILCLENVHKEDAIPEIY